MSEEKDRLITAMEKELSTMIDATTLGIIYQPDIRERMNKNAQEDIRRMIETHTKNVLRSVMNTVDICQSAKTAERGE